MGRGEGYGSVWGADTGEKGGRMEESENGAEDGGEGFIVQDDDAEDERG